MDSAELSYPNENIYKNYGRLDDSSSRLAKSQYLLVRHGLSCANEFEGELSLKAKTQPNSLHYYHTEYWNFKKHPFL